MNLSIQTIQQLSAGVFTLITITSCENSAVVQSAEIIDTSTQKIDQPDSTEDVNLSPDSCFFGNLPDNCPTCGMG